MRNNQPITQDEYVIPKGLTLVSTTDLQGNITSVNDAFEIASGYSREEMIGQPHNMVRHPDVPEAVFKDLWTTLKMDATWSQIVKNRRKDGGFYWVRANVTPIYENGKMVGYMSFRTEVSDAEKHAAAQAYKDIKSGRAKIQYGKVFSGVNWAQLNLFGKLNPQWQLSLLTLIFSVIPFIFVGIDTKLNPALIALIAMIMIIPGLIWGLSNLKTMRSIRKAMRSVAANEAIDMSCTRPTHYDGKMINRVISASIAIRNAIEESHSKTDEAAKLQTAIDKVTSNIMIADANLNITYMNEQMTKFMKDKESTLQAFLPHFDANNLIGKNIDVFHKDPSHQRGMLNKIKEPYLAKITLGNTHLEVNAIPVFNRAGLRTATLAEWRDKTQEVQLLEQVNASVEAAKRGILDRRIDLSKVDGLAKELSQSMNDMLATIEEPINEAVNLGINLAEGDLSHHVKGDFHGRFALLQDSMNVAVDNLSSMMAQTKVAIKSVGDGAAEIKNSSLDLNDRTQNQAASLEETAASMEQMTATVKQNADNAVQAADSTSNATIQAQDGVQVMENAIHAMEQIHESSQKISDIIALIDSIAFQTNLLALNAAVEAARAGEHGRGFAVVAGEVRTLAGKSADAAKDIRQLIEDTVNKVSEGTQHVKGSGDALNEIVNSIQSVNQIIEEISRSSAEQSEGVSQVNSAIANIDSAVQQNAALVEESAATSEHLGTMSEQMDKNISQFTLNTRSVKANTAENTVFDFSGARRAHRQWRVKVRAYINDVQISFDRAAAADGSRCSLGQWLYGQGKEFNSLPSFQAVEKHHMELHTFIGKIMDLKDAGDIEQANAEVDKLEAMSDHVIQLIDELEHNIANGGAAMAQHHALERMAESTESSPAPQAKPVPAAKATVKPSPQPAVKPAAQASGLQVPPPSQPKMDNGDEWGEF